jgi:hypothetical protein
MAHLRTSRPVTITGLSAATAGTKGCTNGGGVSTCAPTKPPIVR